MGAAAAVIAPLSFSAAAAIGREGADGGSPVDDATRRARSDQVIARFNQFNDVGALLGGVLTGVVGAGSLQIGFAVPVGRVFDLVATPGEHHRFDASSMVGRAVTPERLTAVGDVFTMEMTYRSGTEIEHYRTDNHVTAFEDDGCLEWAVAPHDGEVLGWRWRYDLEPGSPGTTRATLSYDWSGTQEATIRRFGVPLFDEEQIGASLVLLARAAEDS